MKKIRNIFLGLLAALFPVLATLPLQATPAGAIAGGVGYGGAAQRVVELTRQLSEDSARLAALNNQVEKAQGELDKLNRKLAADRRQEDKVRAQLKAMARFDYEQSQSPLVMLISSPSISEFMGELAQVQLLASKQTKLVDQAVQLGHQDQVAHDQARVQLGKIEAARRQALAVAANARAMLGAARDAELRATAASLAQQAAQGSAVRYSGTGSGRNHFDYGYCTWWVANKRYIPWYGNALEWWPNARAYGYAEGQTPVVGAVMVTDESSYGHVAYVESIHPDGSWTVSEMNEVGWAKVDYRTIRRGQVPLIGFIYGKG
ncbi:MAG: CHAP domain-containing protein [Candidatus Dormibacteraceae bacterium]